MKKIPIITLTFVCMASQAFSLDVDTYKKRGIVNGCSTYEDCMNKSEDVFQFTNDARTVAVLKAIAMELHELNKNLKAINESTS